MQDLGVGCDRIKVRKHSAVQEEGISPILITVGAIGILALISATTTIDIPITTGILGGKVVAIKRQLPNKK